MRQKVSILTLTVTPTLLTRVCTDQRLRTAKDRDVPRGAQLRVGVRVRVRVRVRVTVMAMVWTKIRVGVRIMHPDASDIDHKPFGNISYLQPAPYLYT